LYSDLIHEGLLVREEMAYFEKLRAMKVPAEEGLRCSIWRRMPLRARRTHCPERNSVAGERPTLVVGESISNRPSTLMLGLSREFILLYEIDRQPAARLPAIAECLPPPNPAAPVHFMVPLQLLADDTEATLRRPLGVAKAIVSAFMLISY
jgi:hypothetical protein